MACILRHPIYVPHSGPGIQEAVSRGDGYRIAIQWQRAFESTYGFNVAYNIYYSTVRDNVFSDGVRLVYVEDGYWGTEIRDLTPGEMYYFAVRAFEYDLNVYNPTLLPEAYDGYNLRVYPEALLLSNITETDLIIPISDINLFPAFGVVQIGMELIRYDSVDIPNSSLLLSDPDYRGYYETTARMHNVDGYDGVRIQSPIIRFFIGFEEENQVVAMEAANFTYPNYAYTLTDGYRVVDTDILTTDMSANDATQTDFRPYDYAGWHRTDLSMLVSGTCIGTYIGGELYCADGYLGVGRQLRGIPINEQSHAREEMMLESTGESCMLLRRVHTGIRCSCFLPTAEYPEARCPLCYGTGFTMGYEQYFNPRRSDGRIFVRFEPAEDDLLLDRAGLESKFIPNCWTLVVPSVKDRDVLVRYDEDGMRQYAYEILNVTRNKIFEGFSGAQKFSAERVRRTDPIYQIKLADNTATMPQDLSTSIGMLRGPGTSTIPHLHSVRISENITNIAQITQTSSISADHSHEIIAGVVTPVLGHTHTIILP